MKQFLLFVLIASALVACSSYGDKYQVNEKSEIYYKDGTTAEQAKALGDFLLKNGYFDDKTEKTVQLSKEKDTISVKFVVDKARLEKDTTSDALFMIVGMAMSSEIFGGQPLRIILADQRLEGFRQMPVAGTSAADTTR